MENSAHVACASPRVSVVIPTYRHRDFVVQTLESVRMQTFTDYEIVVVNDGSPDDTATVLKPLADAGWFGYIEQDNAGQAAARNRGIGATKGEYIALLDDDDLWQADKLAWQVAALDANPEAVVVYGRAQPIDEKGHHTVPLDPRGEPLVLPWETPSGDVYEAFVRQNWIVSPGQCLVRRSAIESLSDGVAFDTDPNLRGNDDWDFWLRLGEVGSFVFEDRTALLYRFHSGNASNNLLQMHRGALKIYDKQIAAAKKTAQTARILTLQAAYSRVKEWSAHDLLLRAHTLYHLSGTEKSPTPAEQAVTYLQFLMKAQPRLRFKPTLLWLYVRLLRNIYRFAPANAHQVTATQGRQ